MIHFEYSKLFIELWWSKIDHLLQSNFDEKKILKKTEFKKFVKKSNKPIYAGEVGEVSVDIM